jgi:hypothetical protein
MNWGRALLAGIVGGVAVTAYQIVIHGFVMADTYMKYPVFAVQPVPNRVWFLVVAILMGCFAAIIFAKTRSAWAPGTKGGLVFGFWLGWIGFFAQFYPALTIAGFPYYLSWCWGGIELIGWLIFGWVAGALYKVQSA